MPSGIYEGQRQLITACSARSQCSEGQLKPFPCEIVQCLWAGIVLLDAAGAHPAYGQTNGLACFQEQVFIMV